MNQTRQTIENEPLQQSCIKLFIHSVSCLLFLSRGSRGQQPRRTRYTSTIFSNLW